MIVVVAVSPTRERLMSAALKLFAERGYKATTVGAIETKAGLSPRSGALYQHFKSKQELLEAAIENELAAVGELSDALALLPLGAFRAASMTSALSMPGSRPLLPWRPTTAFLPAKISPVAIGSVPWRWAHRLLTCRSISPAGTTRSARSR